MQVLPTPLAPDRRWRGDLGQFQGQAYAQRRLPSMPLSPDGDPTQVKRKLVVKVSPVLHHT